MRKALYALPIAAAAFVTPALAQPYYDTPYPAVAPVVAGAAVGTTLALGAYNSWFGGAVGAALPTSAVGAAAVGGVAAMGTAAFVDALLQPCRGFHAMFDLNHGACVNGEYVGYGPRPVAYRYSHRRRAMR
jgi:hypothetical protein